MAFRRFVAILAIVLASLASTIATASAATTQDAGIPVVFTVYAPGKSPVADATTIGALEQGCPTTTLDLPLYGPNGTVEPDNPPAPQEWALATVLSGTAPACLPTPIPIQQISQVTVLESNGQPDLNPSAQLTPADLTLPSDFSDSSAWPVFWDGGTSVTYERPIRGSADDNATDQVTVVPGQSLSFDVFEGSAPVAVGINASATSVSPGTAITFTANVPGGASGETLSWGFDGAAPAASGSSVSATFTNPGVYAVSVEASGAVDGFGQIEVSVGATPAATGTATTPTGPVAGGGTTPGAPVPEPKRKHKAKPLKRVQKTTAPSVSANEPAATSTVGVGSAGGSTGAGGASPAGGSAAGSTGAGGAGAGQKGANSTSGGGKLRAPVKRRRKVSGPPASGPAATVGHPHTVVVSGRLLGSVVESAGAASAGRSASGRALGVNRPAGGWPWAGILGGLAVVVLLGLGAGRELRAIRWAP